MLNGKSLSIGIYCPPFSSVKDVLNTLDSINLSKGSFYIKIVVIADGNNHEIGLQEHQNYSIKRNDKYSGKASCFNLLISSGNSDFFAFLEAGVLLGPECLQQLLNCFIQDKHCGLAGPSTNSCWNDQGKLPPDYLKGNYRIVSERIKNEYGNDCVELTPLYSLSDFCYVIKKEVIDEIGHADEAYGTGSCWEMDFNVRATRKGFKGIWVKAAFAQRTLNYPQEDIQKSKQLYQNKFCALQQNGHQSKYKDHCLGDHCNNFARPNLIKMKLDLKLDQPVANQKQYALINPMVSCIMPTSNRPHFVKKAIEFFNQQDYQNKELVIVYNDNSDIPNGLNLSQNVRIIKVEARSIGAKRNEGCKQAKGSIIAQWDDDDIYMPDRLTVQIKPLLSGAYEITGLNNFAFYESEVNSFWECTTDLFNRIFLEGVAGGTLVYLKFLWENYIVYPNISIREDAEFLIAALRNGARLKRIDGRNLFIYHRHSLNTWRFNVGSYYKSQEWKLINEPVMYEV